MQSTRDIALDFVFLHEGGLVDHPDDPGGRTIYGISERANPEAWKNGPPSKEEAREIYVRKYWEPLDLEKLDNHFAIVVFDSAVQHGVGTARSWLTEHPTLEGFLARRIEFYTQLSTWASFGKGWARRMAALIKLLDTIPREVDVVIDNRPLFARVLGAFHGETRNVAYRVRLLQSWSGTKMDLEESRGDNNKIL